MAETENSAPAKFDKDALREWFTLEQVADRWGCTTDDLLHYGDVGLLDLCIRPGVEPLNFILAPWGDETGPRQYLYNENADEMAWDYALSFYSLIPVGGRCLQFISKTGRAQVTVKKIPSIYGVTRYLFDLPFDNDMLSHKKPFIDDDSREWRVTARLGIDIADQHKFTITRNDLLIPKEELDGFEKEHRIGAHAGEMPKLDEQDADNLHPRKEKTYLNTIAAMLNLMTVDSRKTQAEIINDITDMHGHRHGISKRKLEEIFPKAKKSLDNS